MMGVAAVVESDRAALERQCLHHLLTPVERRDRRHRPHALDRGHRKFPAAAEDWDLLALAQCCRGKFDDFLAGKLPQQDIASPGATQCPAREPHSEKESTAIRWVAATNELACGGDFTHCPAD